MTRNEKIAEEMGWTIWQKTSQGPFPKILYHISDARGYSLYSEYHPFDFNSNCGWEIAKLLQARMRQDGWKITIEHFPFDDPPFAAVAQKVNEKYHQLIGEKHIVGKQSTEPAALHALFCKVNGITDEN